MSVSYEEYARRFDEAFSKPDTPTVPMCQGCGKPPAECGCITLQELAERIGPGTETDAGIAIVRQTWNKTITN